MGHFEREQIKNQEAAIAAKDAEIERLKDDNAELQAIFDLRWKRDMEAIAIWRGTDPSRQLTMPDHGDLVTFLLDRFANKETPKDFGKCWYPDGEGPMHVGPKDQPMACLLTADGVPVCKGLIVRDGNGTTFEVIRVSSDATPCPHYGYRYSAFATVRDLDGHEFDRCILGNCTSVGFAKETP